MKTIKVKTLLLLCITLLNSPAFGANEVPPWKGNVGFSFSENRTDYVSRKLTVNIDVTRTENQNETVSECSLDKQHFVIPGDTSRIETFRYDANVKWKHYYDDSPYYSYLSPRVRHNNTGYFTATQALRLGGGRKILLDNDLFEMAVELGVGYRFATLADHSRINENLFTVSDKFTWAFTDELSLKLNFVHEQSAREKYRTVTLELVNKFTHNLGVKYQIVQKRTYPFESNSQSGEYTSSIGLDYAI
jgi:putative salt-induced outer membrane protein